MEARLPASAVKLCGDDIDAAQYGDDVAELVVADQMGEHGEMNEGRRTGAGSVGAGFGVADDVEAEFSVGRFCGGVNLFPGDGISAVGHDDLEVLNQPLDAAVDGGLRWEHHIAFDADIHAAARNVFNGLFDNFQAFEEFLHADEITGIAVTSTRTDDVEIQIGVCEIGFIAAKIALDATCACHGACGAEVDRIFTAEVPDAPGAIHKDPVFGEQSIDFVVDFGEFANEFSHAIYPVQIDIKEHSADSRVAGVETLTGGQFHDVVDVFALLEEIKEGREASEVECSCAEIQQVIMHPHEFCEDCSKITASGCEFDTQQFLDGVVPGDFIGQWRQVIHPIDDGHILVEVQMLAQFLEAAVQVADVRNGIENFFAVEREHEPQRGVSRGVLRAEVQRPDVFAVRRFRGGCVDGSERHWDRRNSQR
jgi:hypothetical protein